MSEPSAIRDLTVDEFLYGTTLLEPHPVIYRLDYDPERDYEYLTIVEGAEHYVSIFQSEVVEWWVNKPARPFSYEQMVELFALALMEEAL